MKRRHLIYSLCFGLLMGLAAPAYAQQPSKTIKGTVVDEKGEPIIGASVIVVGSSEGTITDFDGNYTLSVPEKGKIQVRYIGYVPQTISNVNNMGRVVLLEDNLNLDEVVVVGYGTQKGKNVTGSIEVVNMKDLEDLAVMSLGDALAGMVNGLHVSSTGNRPGEAAHLTIRQSTALAKNNGQVNARFSTQDDTPLYVIDDFISSEDDFNSLDISEVESISVLKDAAAAIYGAQGAYGVILVKTKRGKVGTPKISYSGQFGYTDALELPKMMNSYDYARTWNAYKGARTVNDDVTDLLTEYFQADELEALRNINYDLVDQEWKAALTQRHSLNINGGTEKATYFASVTYNTQEGNVGKLDYERWNYRAGVNANIGKWIKTAVQISGNYGEKNTPYNKYGSSDSDSNYSLILQHLPFVPDVVDGYPIIYSGMENVPAADLADDAKFNYYAVQNSPNYNNNTNNDFNINGSIEVDMGFWKPLEGLKFKASYSKNVANSKNNNVGTNLTVYRLMNRLGSGGHLYTGEGADYSITNLDETTVDNGNLLRRTMSRSDSYQLNFTATYARTFGKHNVSALFSIERGESESEDIQGTILSPLSFTDGQSRSASGDRDVEWGRTESGRLSYIGRLNYSYADKYLFEFLIRSDASTKFAPRHYWGTFPSVSAGWVISEENWFKENVTFMDFLKVRGSFGILGRDNVNAFVWLTRFERDLGAGAVFGIDTSSTVVSPAMVTVQGGANPDAHWDKTYKSNFGLDMRFLNSRLNVTLDAYYDMGREIFGSHQGTRYFPMTVGIKPTPENYVEKDTWGVELNVGWRDKIGKNFTYWVKMSTGYDDDKVKTIAVKEQPGLTDPMPGERQDRGLWGYECMGIFRNYQQIEEYVKKYNIKSYMGLAPSAIRPGMLIYKDVHGEWNPETKQYNPEPDGIVSRTDDSDKVKLSHRSSNPYGMTFNFGASYKDFSIQAQLGASWGAYVMAGGNIRKAASGLEFKNIPNFWTDMYVYEDVLDATGNVIAKANHNAKYPSIQYESLNTVESSFWRLKGTTVSLTNISMSWSVPRNWIRPVGISSCRLNLTCQNAINFVSPHIEDAWSTWGGGYGNYPNLRKITLGVNVSF